MTSGSVVRNNLEQWAGQWAEELNELGAPFYHDEREALLGVERFIAKYPEIDHVTWYREDGSVLMLSGRAGEQSTDAPPLASPVRDNLAAKAGVTPPFLLTENVDAQRFRFPARSGRKRLPATGYSVSIPPLRKPRSRCWAS